MKTTLLSTLLFAFTALSHAEDFLVERSYSWGSIRASAAHSETMRIGDTSLLVLRTDVLADFRFADGKRYLLAAGRLEFDPSTGNFTGTDWPFLCEAFGTRINHYTAVSGVSSVQVHGEHVKLAITSRTYIGGEPAIMQLRRQQLARLEKGLSP